MKAPLLVAFRLGKEIEHLSLRIERKCGISLGQWSVLIRLKDLPSVTAQDLASAVGVHPSTLTQALKRLQRKGYIFIGKDPRDSRKKILSLTREGAEVLKAARRALQPWRDEVSVMVGPMERLAKLISKLQ